MPRPTSKSELINAAQETYGQLNELITSLTQTELLTPMKFSETKKEAHWKRDKNLRDVLTHLYEWHQLLTNWVTSNLEGETRSLLPQPYNWRNYGKSIRIQPWKKQKSYCKNPTGKFWIWQIPFQTKNCSQKGFIPGLEIMPWALISFPTSPAIITGRSKNSRLTEETARLNFP